MKKQWFPSILTLTICVLIVLLLACGEEIDSPLDDSHEKTDVERALWLEFEKEPFSPFTDDDLATVRRLHVKDAWPGRVSEDYDLMLLARCVNLIELKLPDQHVPHLKWLTGLRHLTKLELGNNVMIADLSPLEGLVNLQYLNLRGNNIADITPLQGLVQLKVVNLGENRIVDLKPLVDNVGLSQGDIVVVGGNPLSDVSKNEHIPALEAREVTVHIGLIHTPLF